jgi:predicted 3-demethylubiquinone-9 3-methyltransferase (glyoxalase superfamily)
MVASAPYKYYKHPQKIDIMTSKSAPSHALINNRTRNLTMQKITPHLWYDKEAEEAANLYKSTFKDAEITQKTTLNNTPSGTAQLITMKIMGQTFTLLNGGPYYKFNPSTSFLVTCKTRDEVDKYCKQLSANGSALMELGEYPFSSRYAWIQDKYGLSWQIMLADIHDAKQRITPTLMFVGDVCGKAEEAINLYTSIFHDSKIEGILRYQAGMQPDKEGTIQHAGFTLESQAFAAMDSAHEHKFSFNEAISLMINCESQTEVDYYWEKLSADPKAEQCGWLKDKYGLSWQVVPTILAEMLRKGDKESVARVTEAFLKMKKFDIKALRKAYEGS